MKFTTETWGKVTGVRFYKSAANTGTHTGSLWGPNGERLATATFTNETSSGWQQVTFATPVYVLPHTTYTASYFDRAGHYAVTRNYFYNPPAAGGNALNSPPLHAVPASGIVGNGVFSEGTSTFPTRTYNGSNYWVDVVFEPADVPAPGQVTNVSATAGSSSASVSWSAPSEGGPVTQYTVTPYIGPDPQPATTVTGSPPVNSATIRGLTIGTSYTFTVQASNPNGAGPVSDPSNAVTPVVLTQPFAPTGVTASAATRQALVSWTEPADNGGSPITGYVVTPYVGLTAKTPLDVGPGVTSAIVNGLTNGTSYTFKVTATNVAGSSPPSAASGAVVPRDTIFDFTTPATTAVETDEGEVELGVKFSSGVAGTVTGIRFYKGTTNTGTHIGSLWSASGTLLASATFENETASGWQQVNFSTPVDISPNTTYVAGYLAPHGHYAVTRPGFLFAGVSNPPLQALATSPFSGNGVYAYGPTSPYYTSSFPFPTETYEATNYSVDVDFAPATPVPSAPTGVTASAATSQALVSWTAPASSGDGPITGYEVTPYVGPTAQTPLEVGPGATSAIVKGLTNGTSYTFKVTAANVAGSGPPSAASGAVVPHDTIFDFTTPATISTEAASLELGVKFSSDLAGTVTGIRFYKGTANTGTHTGSLWSASGTLLASATFENETASGWQQVNFSTPVDISPNTTYVASYFDPAGYYAYGPYEFALAGVSNPPLQALASLVSEGTAGNGVYAYSTTSTFPTSSYHSANYWVDVDFEPVNAPAVVTEAASSVTQTSATLNATVNPKAAT